MTYPEKTRTTGAYHLHEKSRNSGWKIKWLLPFRLGSFKNYELWFEGIQYFSTLLVCSADSDTDIVMGSSFHHVKFHSFMFMHKIFTQAICVNGKHLRYNLASGSWRELACAKLSSHPVGWLPNKSDEDTCRKIEIKTLRGTNLCLGKNITIFSPFPQTESPFTGYLKLDIVASYTSLSDTWIRKYSDFQS